LLHPDRQVEKALFGFLNVADFKGMSDSIFGRDITNGVKISQTLSVVLSRKSKKLPAQLREGRGRNARVKENAEIARARKPSEGEETLVLVAPLLLSFAVALRITKVTGEIRLG
jgi:hypothetical protein